MKLPQTGIAAIVGIGLIIAANSASQAASTDHYPDFLNPADFSGIGQHLSSGPGGDLWAIPVRPNIAGASPAIATNFDEDRQTVPLPALTSLSQCMEGIEAADFQLNLNELGNDRNPFADLHFSGKKLITELYNSMEVQLAESSWAQSSADIEVAGGSTAPPVHSSIPNFMFLLGSGLLGIIAIRRRKSSKE